MKEKFIRLLSTDNIEMPGFINYPENKTDKIVIHIHGRSGGNFTEEYIKYLVEAYDELGYAFLTFNNRGAGFFTEFLKHENNQVVSFVGGCTNELFKESIYDIEGAINWAKEQGFNEIILSGHSYGCHKVVAIIITNH